MYIFIILGLIDRGQCADQATFFAYLHMGTWMCGLGQDSLDSYACWITVALDGHVYINKTNKLEQEMTADEKAGSLLLTFMKIMLRLLQKVTELSSMFLNYDIFIVST